MNLFLKISAKRAEVRRPEQLFQNRLRQEVVLHFRTTERDANPSWAESVSDVLDDDDADVSIGDNSNEADTSVSDEDAHEEVEQDVWDMEAVGLNESEGQFYSISVTVFANCAIRGLLAYSTKLWLYSNFANNLTLNHQVARVR